MMLHVWTAKSGATAPPIQSTGAKWYRLRDVVAARADIDGWRNGIHLWAG